MVRNFNAVQFEALRKVIDEKINLLHDELTDCFYNNKPFKTFGILNKITFDKLHGLLFKLYDIRFHTENLKLPIVEQIPEEKYRYIYAEDGMTVKIDKYQTAVQQVALLKIQGYELNL